jgi:hypothetical protein
MDSSLLGETVTDSGTSGVVAQGVVTSLGLDSATTHVVPAVAVGTDANQPALSSMAPIGSEPCAFNCTNGKGSSAHGEYRLDPCYVCCYCSFVICVKCLEKRFGDPRRFPAYHSTLSAKGTVKGNTTKPSAAPPKPDVASDQADGSYRESAVVEEGTAQQGATSSTASGADVTRVSASGPAPLQQPAAPQRPTSPFAYSYIPCPFCRVNRQDSQLLLHDPLIVPWNCEGPTGGRWRNKPTHPWAEESFSIYRPLREETLLRSKKWELEITFQGQLDPSGAPDLVGGAAGINQQQLADARPSPPTHPLRGPCCTEGEAFSLATLNPGLERKLVICGVNLALRSSRPGAPVRPNMVPLAVWACPPTLPPHRLDAAMIKASRERNQFSVRLPEGLYPYCQCIKVFPIEAFHELQSATQSQTTSSTATKAGGPENAKSNTEGRIQGDPKASMSQKSKDKVKKLPPGVALKESDAPDRIEMTEKAPAGLGPSAGNSRPALVEMGPSDQGGASKRSGATILSGKEALPLLLSELCVRPSQGPVQQLLELLSISGLNAEGDLEELAASGNSKLGSRAKAREKHAKSLSHPLLTIMILHRLHLSPWSAEHQLSLAAKHRSLLQRFPQMRQLGLGTPPPLGCVPSWQLNYAVDLLQVGKRNVAVFGLGSKLLFLRTVACASALQGNAVFEIHGFAAKSVVEAELVELEKEILPFCFKRRMWLDRLNRHREEAALQSAEATAIPNRSASVIVIDATQPEPTLGPGPQSSLKPVALTPRLGASDLPADLTTTATPLIRSAVPTDPEAVIPSPAAQRASELLGSTAMQRRMLHGQSVARSALRLSEVTIGLDSTPVMPSGLSLDQGPQYRRSATSLTPKKGLATFLTQSGSKTLVQHPAGVAMEAEVGEIGRDQVAPQFAVLSEKARQATADVDQCGNDQNKDQEEDQDRDPLLGHSKFGAFGSLEKSMAFPQIAMSAAARTAIQRCFRKRRRQLEEDSPLGGSEEGCDPHDATKPSELGTKDTEGSFLPAAAATCGLGDGVILLLHNIDSLHATMLQRLSDLYRYWSSRLGNATRLQILCSFDDPLFPSSCPTTLANLLQLEVVHMATFAQRRVELYFRPASGLGSGPAVGGGGIDVEEGRLLNGKSLPMLETLRRVVRSLTSHQRQKLSALLEYQDEVGPNNFMHMEELGSFLERKNLFWSGKQIQDIAVELESNRLVQVQRAGTWAIRFLQFRQVQEVLQEMEQLQANTRPAS